MDVMSIIENRHSVRQYLDKPIEDDKREILNNIKSGPCSKIDLGIVKCHFEMVSGHKTN